MCIEKEFLAYESGYENGLDDVVGEEQDIKNSILNCDGCVHNINGIFKTRCCTCCRNKIDRYEYESIK